MKKSFVFLFLIAILASTYYGLKNHFGLIEKMASQKTESISHKKGERIYPVLEDQMIVAIVLAENSSKNIERNLESLNCQTYPHKRIIFVDNGSTDGTYERAEAYSKNKEMDVELIRFNNRKPRMEVLFEVIGRCDPQAVVALIEGNDWLFHENVFDHLNCAYANPDVWMTHSKGISHPEYKEVKGEKWVHSKVMRQDPSINLSPLVTFYAGFFQEIKLQDFLYQGKFIDECYQLATLLPLLEMGPAHLHFMDEVSYVNNELEIKVDHQLHLQKIAAVESYLRSLPSYLKLSQLRLTLNSPSFHRYKSDVIIFSEDSPLHLYACLESLFLKGRDINEVFVLYKGSDPEFQRAYLNLESEFHTAEFLNICDYPGNDYPSLMSKVFASRRHASPYVVLLDDQLIFEESVRFHDCIAAMEKVHADHFFLSLEIKKQESHPSAIPIAQGIYAYQLGVEGESFPFTLSLCRKSLFESLEDVEDLPSFRKLWQRKLAPSTVALFYEEKKILPLTSIASPTLTQKKEWGHKFIEGFKIDLPSLTCEAHEVDKGELPLIKRDRRRITVHN